MNILVTGHAGFIGFTLVKRLFKEMQTGRIVGIAPSTKLRVNKWFDGLTIKYEYNSIYSSVC